MSSSLHGVFPHYTPRRKSPGIVKRGGARGQPREKEDRGQLPPARDAYVAEHSTERLREERYFPTCVALRPIPAGCRVECSAIHDTQGPFILPNDPFMTQSDNSWYQ